MSVHRKIRAIENILERGYQIERSFSRREKIYLDKNQRERLEAGLVRLKKLNRCYLIWESVRPVLEWDSDKKQMVFKRFEQAGGTYVFAVHGPIGRRKRVAA